MPARYETLLRKATGPDPVSVAGRGMDAGGASLPVSAARRTRNRAIQAAETGGARLVIANRPEGREVADALADRLGGPVVVFDNFPPSGEADGFDRMLRRNVRALVEAVPP
jgi:hypothetical protein